MKFLIPAISQARITRCLNSLKIDPAQIIIVDNSPNGLDLPITPGKVVRTGKNLGVSRAWNIGINSLDDNDEHLIVCSQSLVFGSNGGLELYDTLTDEWGAEYTGMAWHLNAFTRKFLDTFGYFDENFYPAYYEDTDALYRMGLLDMPSPRENGRTRPYFQIDATCETAGTLNDGLAKVDFGLLRSYYVAKWGGDQGKERFKTPFNDDHHINWWNGVEQAGSE